MRVLRHRCKRYGGIFGRHAACIGQVPGVLRRSLNQTGADHGRKLSSVDYMRELLRLRSA